MSSDGLAVSIAALSVYPVKSCAGVSLNEAVLVETGLELDRHWMLVDEQGVFVTQRELPRMALIRPTLKHSEMVLRTDGMLALHIDLAAAQDPVRVKLWSDEVAAYDMGDMAAQWFSDFLAQRVRMVRFDPAHKRLSDARWAGAIAAENAFGDGFPLLVVSEASLADLNARLGLRGVLPVVMARFRPNLVLAGLDAYGEDHLDEIAFDTPEGRVRLRLVKPCPRCPVPNVDPLSGEPGIEPGDTLSSYRANAALGGAISFGMNAIIVEGIDCGLRVGQRGTASLRFD